MVSSERVELKRVAAEILAKFDPHQLIAELSPLLLQYAGEEASKLIIFVLCNMIMFHPFTSLLVVLPALFELSESIFVAPILSSEDQKTLMGVVDMLALLLKANCLELQQNKTPEELKALQELTKRMKVMGAKIQEGYLRALMNFFVMTKDNAELSNIFIRVGQPELEAIQAIPDIQSHPGMSQALESASTFKMILSNHNSFQN